MHLRLSALPLLLLFSLHTPLTLAIIFPSPSEVDPEVGFPAAGAADPKPIDDDTSTGCTTLSCPHDSPSGRGNSGDSSTVPTNGGDKSEKANEAAEVIASIQDVIDDISSIVSPSVSTSTLSDDSTSVYTITTHPPLPTAAYACLSAQSIYSSCGQGSGKSNFANRVVSQQASCLCYGTVGGGGGSEGGDVTTTTAWVPWLFDGYVRDCHAFVATQTVVKVSSSISATVTMGARGICAGVGDVRASPSASATGQVSSATTTTTNSGTGSGSASTSSSGTQTSSAEVTGGAGGRGRRKVDQGTGYALILLIIGVVVG